MCSVPIHPRDVRAAKATLGAKTNRFRRRKDRAELVRVMEDAAEAFNLRRLARVASKIGGAR